MERDETKIIIRKLAILYGNQFKLDDPVFVIDTWHDILKEYDYDRVLRNLNTHVKNSEYPPKPKDLLKDLVVNEKYNIPGIEETKAIIETYQVPKDQQMPKEERDKLIRQTFGGMDHVK